MLSAKEIEDTHEEYRFSNANGELAWHAFARAIEAIVRERTIDECAAISKRWGETHDAGVTVNARNAGSKIERGILALKEKIK
jgi:hypothetical protein